MPGYAELQCTSNFTFLRGASHPEELVNEAARLGHAAVAITDENSLAGVVRAHVAAQAAGIRLVIGARITPADGPPLLMYPTDRAAYGRLSRLITVGRRRAEKGQCALTLADVFELGAGQLVVALPPARCDDAFMQSARRIRDHFADRCYLAAGGLYAADSAERLRRLRDVSDALQAPLVAANDVHYHAPQRRRLQDVLTCIRAGCTIAEAGHRLFAHAERHLKPPQEMERLFRDLPGAVARTREIADRCPFRLDELRYEYPVELAPPGLSPMQYLTQLAWRGARERFGGDVPDKIRRTIEHELRLIADLRYEAFFLTVYDIVSFARSRGILCQGRGSAANSAVCYCIGVTSVDPARIDLLFERFVSRERNEPPDIDVDFEHERREEVIQYIYGKYGRERAGMTAEVITYRMRSALRDAGKALGLPLDVLDHLSGLSSRWDGERLPDDRLRALGLDPASRSLAQFVELAHELAGFPRHLSQHVGGFVITRGPLCEMVPIENAAMDGRTVIEWNKDDIDALGLLKVDVLGLGMLTCIRKGFELVERHHGRALTLATVPAEDPAVYDMCCRADTIGVFQIESRGQMTMLPRLKPRHFHDLVIEVAILRPGPIQGKMVHPYLRRRHGLEAVTYPSDAVRGVLEKTLGVPLFQEQVMRLAVVAAGFSEGEADRLRRAMASWGREGVIEVFRERFTSGMLANGYTPELTEQLFEQILGFGGYGFPESHSASFALLVYVSAWLKRYYPAAFAAALLNSQPMGFYAPAQIVRDAREHGVEVRGVDVNESDWDCTLEHDPDTESDAARHADRSSEWGRDGPALRLGLRLCKGLSQATADAIVAARTGGFAHAGGRFTSLDDLTRRTALGAASLRPLMDAGAFAGLGLDRRAARWALLPQRRAKRAAGESAEPLLAGLQPAEPAVRLPALPLGERIVHDYAALGLSLEAHPLSLLRERLRSRGVMSAAELTGIAAKRWVRVAGLVICRQCPETAGGVLFVTLEDETAFANLIVRPGVFERHRPALLTATAIMARGTIERQGEVMHVMVAEVEDLSTWLPRLPVASRDFH